MMNGIHPESTISSPIAALKSITNLYEQYIPKNIPNCKYFMPNLPLVGVAWIGNVNFILLRNQIADGAHMSPDRKDLSKVVFCEKAKEIEASRNFILYVHTRVSCMHLCKYLLGPKVLTKLLVRCIMYNVVHEYHGESSKLNNNTLFFSYSNKFDLIISILSSISRNIICQKHLKCPEVLSSRDSTKLSIFLYSS
jgi:hypothetical protein